MHPQSAIRSVLTAALAARSFNAKVVAKSSCVLIPSAKQIIPKRAVTAAAAAARPASIDMARDSFSVRSAVVRSAGGRLGRRRRPWGKHMGERHFGIRASTSTRAGLALRLLVLSASGPSFISKCSTTDAFVSKPLPLNHRVDQNVEFIPGTRKRRRPGTFAFSSTYRQLKNNNNGQEGGESLDPDAEPFDNEDFMMDYWDEEYMDGEFDDDMDGIVDLYPDDGLALFNSDGQGEELLSAESLSNVFGNLTLAATPSVAEQPDIAYFYLKDKIGLSDETMWKITFEAGTVLGLTAETLDWKISVLRRNMKLSDDDIREIINKYPECLQCFDEI